VVNPRQAPEVVTVREQVRSWRFYDHLRTDEAAPARRTQIGTRTPVLAADGRDLAAAIQTIIEIGHVGGLETTITDTFPGSRLRVLHSAGRFDLQFSPHGLLQPLSSAELSDGTLRYLLLVAALLSPRPPGLMVLNEPETSLHPELLAPLARLIIQASAKTQIIVVSHPQPDRRAATGSAIPGNRAGQGLRRDPDQRSRTVRLPGVELGPTLSPVRR
jgi:predicted ATPase